MFVSSWYLSLSASGCKSKLSHLSRKFNGSLSRMSAYVPSDIAGDGLDGGWGACLSLDAFYIYFCRATHKMIASDRVSKSLNSQFRRQFRQLGSFFKCFTQKRFFILMHANKIYGRCKKNMIMLHNGGLNHDKKNFNFIHSKWAKRVHTLSKTLLYLLRIDYFAQV